MRSLLTIYIRSLKILWTEKVMTASLCVAGVFAALVQLYEPIIFGRVIDTLSQKADSVALLITWTALGVFNVVVSVFLAVMADRLAHRQRLAILGRVFERVIGLPVNFHTSQGTGKVVRTILSGTDQLFTLWLAFMREHLPAIVGIIVLVPTAVTMDVRMASLLFCLAFVYSVCNFAILNRTHGGQALVETYHQDVFGRVGDVIGNVTVVQSYTRLTDEIQALQAMMTRLLSAQYPVLTWWGLLTVITRIAATVTMVAIVGLGSYLSMQGEITVGEIVAFTGFSSLLISKLDQVSSFLSKLVMQGTSLRFFFELLDKDDGAVDLPHARALTTATGHISFNNVTYKYGSEGFGVFDLNFEAPAGHTVALVGASGSGKTTTLALLQRLFDPAEGSITFDGTDIREYTIASLRQFVAVVFQDSGLFNRSIAENIRVGKPWATDEEVEAAAVKASAHSFIQKKPGGYNFVIGERGMSLSGGERQRVAIARAVLKDAPVLIFDEATSALDNETELKIQKALTSLRHGKTTFIIAHRLSTVVAADLILVFDQGRIVESGKFLELRHKRGAFARLLEAGEIDPEKKGKNG